MFFTIVVILPSSSHPCGRSKKVTKLLVPLSGHHRMSLPPPLHSFAPWTVYCVCMSFIIYSFWARLGVLSRRPDDDDALIVPLGGGILWPIPNDAWLAVLLALGSTQIPTMRFGCGWVSTEVEWNGFGWTLRTGWMMVEVSVAKGCRSINKISSGAQQKGSKWYK